FVVIKDMEDELIHIGSGRSRGLGKITATISTEEKNGRPGGLVTSTIRGNNEPADQLWGLGRWLNDESYGTLKGDADLLKLSLPIERIDRGIRRIRVFTGANLSALRDAAIENFIMRMQNW